ncbi:hypothetical protein I79_015233 [Cricetulus griseus]|uniref:Uncharacterized protein n=1 Tax=Cricetulus griseus TaxID=10029 RepID=G3HW79_CRIGR|nr:hypothetical protein I79_015233 [Cricetulus griseus]
MRTQLCFCLLSPSNFICGKCCLWQQLLALHKLSYGISEGAWLLLSSGQVASVLWECKGCMELLSSAFVTEETHAEGPSHQPATLAPM